MYLDHWSLERAPFEAQPDSRFLFATEGHEQALAAISYAAREAGEPVLLRGLAGCGKTLLLRALRRQLPRQRYHVAFVPEVTCLQVGLLRRVAYHLVRAAGNNAPTPVNDVAAAMDAILGQVQDAENAGRSIVLMLDNWPADAEPEMFDELGWLLNLDLENCYLCVLLAGEDVRPNAAWPNWLVQRLLTTAQLGPLSRDQVREYLAHRLQVASKDASGGDSRRDVFSVEAASLIAEWSQGIPRLINRLAHLALHVAFVDGAQCVGPDAVHRTIDRLSPRLGDRPDTNAVAPTLAATAEAT